MTKIEQYLEEQCGEKGHTYHCAMGMLEGRECCCSTINASEKESRDDR
jgi:hypothetical protein